MVAVLEASRLLVTLNDCQVLVYTQTHDNDHLGRAEAADQPR